MNVFIFTFALIAVICNPFATAQKGGEEFLAKAKVCQKKNGISDEVFQGLLKTMELKDESIVSHRCLVECLLTAEGTMNNEELDTEKLVMQTKEETEKLSLKLDENAFRTAIKECKKLGGEGQCSAGYYSWKCFYKMIMKGLPLE